MVDAAFGVLGPIRVRHADGRQVSVGGKRRAVLATLLLHVNTTVSRARLIAALWDDPPASAVANVQTYIAQLRRVLPATALLRTQGIGYLLEVAPGEVDLLLFEEQVRLAKLETDPAVAAGRLHSALRLWRGSPAEDAPLTGAMTARLAELEERLADARSDWSDTQLDLGRHAEVIGELRRFVREQPLRERAWQQLMLALSRAGRRGEALEVYQQARAVMIAELGIEPGPELQGLQAAILADAVPVGAPQQAAICQLPPDIADFVGRAEEIATLTTALCRRPDVTGNSPWEHGAPAGAASGAAASGPTALPIVAVTGPPGVGKSTLALHVAHLVRPAFPDGQLYLRLSDTPARQREPFTLLAELLRALHIDGPAIPRTLEERASLYRSTVADQEILVVLDDAGDASQVYHLLPGTPRSAVLVTSRGPLSALPGVTGVQLGVPTEAEACELLTSVAGDVRVRADPDAAQEILLACGRLPLAIRIAAARLAMRPGWPLRDLAARLADSAARLDELTLGRQDVRASFEMSYDVLPEQARRAFRLLGLAGVDSLADWSLAALMGVTRREAESAVETLVLAGLVNAEEADQAGQPRYRMHDLLRAFARERAESEESPARRDGALAGLVAECLRRVRGAALEYPPPAMPPMRDQDAGPERYQQAWLLAERATLEAAVELAAPDQAVELAHRLSPILVSHGFEDEAGRLLEGVVERVPDTRAAMLTRLLLADNALEHRRIRALAPELRLLYDYFEGTDDMHAATYALTSLAIHDLLEGRPAEALARAELAITRFESLGDTHGLLNALITVCGSHVEQGEYDAVAALCRRGIELAAGRRYGDLAVRFWRVLGIACFEQGEYEAAIGHYEESIKLSHLLGWGRGEPIALRRLGEAYGALGQYDVAAEILNWCVPLFSRVGEKHGLALTFYSLGEVSLKRGYDGEARRRFEQCRGLAVDPALQALVAARLRDLERPGP